MPQCAAHTLSNRQFLDGPPVCTLDGTQFPQSDTPLAERVALWYKANDFATVFVPQIGEVVLDKQAVRNSISHGIGRAKVIAFAALPQVIRAGRIIHVEAMAGSTDGLAYYIAAPVQLAGQAFIATALVKSDTNINRVYVHEVFLKEKLQQSAFKTGAVAADTTGKPSRAGAGAVARVLRDLYAVNPKGATAKSEVVNMLPQ